MTTMGNPDGAARARGHATDPLLRASDDDRLATVRVLQDAVARGLLTPDEGSERMAAAFAAVRRAELVPLSADLPAAPERTAPGWRPLATMAVEQVLSSLHRVPGGRAGAAGVAGAVAVLLALLLLVAVGSLVVELFVDGGRGPGRGGFDWN